MAWIGASDLSTRWVADLWLKSGAFIADSGEWVNPRYLSTRWVAQTWLYRFVTLSGANVTQLNLPALPITVFSGAARQSTKVNASSGAVPLAVFPAAAKGNAHATQTSLLSVPLTAYSASISGGIYQIADVTFTVEVASTFGYVKAVVAQNTPNLALAPIEAIVTEGTDINVAATKAAVPLAIISASAKANTSTRAVTTLPLPLVAFAATVNVGLSVTVANSPSVPLAAIPASVGAAVNHPTSIDLQNVPNVPLVPKTVGVLYPVNVIGIRASANVRGIRARATVRAVRAVGEN